MNKRQLNYMYTFKCQDDLEHFGKLPGEVKEEIEKHIVDVICESFVEPADEDYITARLLVQKRMHRAFFWAASQALEKYLKAFLLMRGVSVNNNRFKGHPIVALYREACEVDKQATAISTKSHSKIKILPNVAQSFEEVSVDKFINDIATHGTPDNRYNSFGVSFNSGYLFALDSFVFSLRRQIGVPPIQETLRKLDQSLVEVLRLYNPWFAPTYMEFAEIPNEDFNLSLSGSVTILDRLISRHAPNSSRFVLQWLDKKMKLPRKVKDHLKEGDRKSKTQKPQRNQNKPDTKQTRHPSKF